MLPLPLNGGSGVPPAFQGQRASYVALAAISTLGLALLTSIWSSDVSGSTAVMGLFAVYLASNELLMLYAIFSPACVVVAIIRLAVGPHPPHGRGWHIFFTVLEMSAQLAGGVLAWSLHKSATQAEVPYRPLNQQAPSSSHVQQADPFSAFHPPSQGAGGEGLHPIQSTYQPFPTSQPASVQP